MAVITIDGGLLKMMIIRAADELRKNKDAIDALNVFPVPDGDTGTNMSLTALTAAKELDTLPETASVGEVSKAASFGALKGARGNSGVILSQLFRGFAKELDGVEKANTKQIANAFVRASETAYRAVMKPKEGTMLTVAREMGEKALEAAAETDDFGPFLRAVIAHGSATLKRTPEMLPILKQANVVDAGGLGLIRMIQGAYSRLSDDRPVELLRTGRAVVDFSGLDAAGDDIAFAYCTEFFINYEAPGDTESREAEMKAYLDDIGDSIVVVSDESLMKIHVHSNSPGAILEKALEYGYLSNIKIDNMRLQHNEKISFINSAPPEQAPNKAFGLVSVSSGEGFDMIFESFNVDAVVAGGQTMNPSAQDFADAIAAIGAENIFVLPNNKNIILAAQQAAYLCEGKKIWVVPTKSIPQGINALFNFAHEDDAETNYRRLCESCGEIRTGQITTAVRDAIVGETEIKEGDILCMLDGAIVAIAKSADEGVKELARVMLADEGFFSVYYGEDVSADEANGLSDYFSEKYPDVDFELARGGQPVYQYILSLAQ